MPFSVIIALMLDMSRLIDIIRRDCLLTFCLNAYKINKSKSKGIVMDWGKYFELLIDWKKLPAYRLEPRIDSIIGYYLPEIVGCKKGKKIIGIIPEFPIKKEESNLSNKVDFLLISKEGPHYLVEVKTDSKSLSEKQDDILKRAEKKELEELINEINSIYEASEEKGKYEHLIKKLEKLGIVKITKDEKNKFEFKFIAGKNKEIEIIYVQPSNEKGDNHIIDFKYISDWINKNKNDGDFENELCKALIEWKND